MLDNVDTNAARRSLGEHLLVKGKLNATGLERARRLTVETGERLEVVLIRLGLVTERDLAEELAAFLELPLISDAEFPLAPLLDDRVSRKFLKEARLIPIDDQSDGLVVAMANPMDESALEAVAFAVGKRAIPRVAYPADIDAAYERLYGDGKSEIE